MVRLMKDGVYRQIKDCRRMSKAASAWFKYGLCLFTILLCLCLNVVISMAQSSVNGSFVVDTVPPAAINDLAVANITSDSVRLLWTAPGDNGNSGNATQYDIRYSNIVITNEAEWNAAIQVANETLPKPAGTSEAFMISGLSINTIYYFAIKTADELPNWSSLSNSPGAKTIDNMPPAMVTDLSLNNFSMNSLTLAWTAPGDNNNSGNATQYDIRYSYSRIWNLIDWGNATRLVGEPLPKPAGSREIFLVNGLRSCTTYYFAIRTADEVANWSPLSNNVKAGTGCFDPSMIDVSGGNNITEEEPEAQKSILFRINLLGRIAFGYVNADGELEEEMNALSPDGSISMTLLGGTKLLDVDKKPLSQLKVTRMDLCPSLPQGLSSVVAYDFEPDECAFGFPIKMIIKYREKDIPEGFNPAHFVIAHVSDTTGNVVLIPGVVDTTTNTVIFSIKGTSAYAVLAQAPFMVTKPTMISVVTPEPSPDSSDTAVGDLDEVLPKDDEGYGLLLGMGVGLLVLMGLLVGIGGGILLLGWLLYRRVEKGAHPATRSKRWLAEKKPLYDDNEWDDE